MYTPSRSPAWHRDAIWCAGVVLALATLVLGAAFTWSRLAGEERARDLVRETLRATLLPGAEDDAATLAVRPESPFAPGEPFDALVGSGVRIDPTELEGFTVQDAIDRIAGVWTSLLLDGGAENLTSAVENPALRAQVGAAATGPAAQLVEAELAAELMSAGLDDGTRLANWPLQALQEPGQPVQPVVGLFVFLDPDDLQGLTSRQIGEAAVERLATLVVDNGVQAGRDAITNVNLSARFEQAVSQARAAVHGLFATVLEGRRDELAIRLEEARAALSEAEPEPSALEGVLPASELAGLPPAEANERILDALADRAWREGPEALAPLLQGDVRAERLEDARAAIAAFGRDAREDAVSVAWTAGVVAALALIAMVLLASGAGRLSRPGTAVLLGALPGALSAWWLLSSLPGEDAAAASLPAGARSEGLFGELAGLVRYLLDVVPPEAASVALRTHAVLAGVGAGMVLTALIVLLAAGLRPRRRGYL